MWNDYLPLSSLRGKTVVSAVQTSQSFLEKILIERFHIGIRLISEFLSGREPQRPSWARCHASGYLNMEIESML